MTIPFRRLASFLPSLLLVVACGGAPEAHDARAVAPERAILFGPNLTQAALRLGHADRIAAITDYCHWTHPSPEPPRIGGALDPDLETIARIEPDLLVLQGRSETLRSFAEAQGFAVADVKMDDDVESILRGVVVVDSLLAGGDPVRGRALADTLRAELSRLRRPLSADAPTVLPVISRDPDRVRSVLTAGAGTFVHELLLHVGARAWAQGRGRGYFDVSLEELVARPPDLVLEIAAAGAPTEAERWRDPWVDLLGDGVTVRRLDTPDALIPGPGIVRTARALLRSTTGVEPDGGRR
jgi:iron complex transport system substrate-binding protein